MKNNIIDESFENDIMQEFNDADERIIEDIVDPTKWVKIEQDETVKEMLFGNVPTSKLLINCDVENPIQFVAEMVDDNFLLILVDQTNKYYR